jgi:hypothetical protein
LPLQLRAPRSWARQASRLTNSARLANFQHDRSNRHPKTNESVVEYGFSRNPFPYTSDTPQAILRHFVASPEMAWATLGGPIPPFRTSVGNRPRSSRWKLARIRIHPQILVRRPFLSGPSKSGCCLSVGPPRLLSRATADGLWNRARLASQEGYLSFGSRSHFVSDERSPDVLRRRSPNWWWPFSHSTEPGGLPRSDADLKFAGRLGCSGCLGVAFGFCEIALPAI